MSKALYQPQLNNSGGYSYKMITLQDFFNQEKIMLFFKNSKTNLIESRLTGKLQTRADNSIMLVTDNGDWYQIPKQYRIIAATRLEGIQYITILV